MTAPLRLTDPATFAKVYEEHHRFVLRIVNSVVNDRAVAEEVTQDVFVMLWRRPSVFDARRGELRTFLHVLARSRAVDAWRAAQARAAAQERFRTQATDARHTDEDVVDHVERRTRAKHVRAAMGTLSHPQREALTLAYWAGLPASDISSRTGVPLGTAKSRVRLGLAHVQAELRVAAVGLEAPGRCPSPSTG